MLKRIQQFPIIILGVCLVIKDKKGFHLFFSHVSTTEYLLKTSLILKSLIDSALFCLQFLIFCSNYYKRKDSEMGL